MIREKVFTVKGMDCADCALKIEGAVSKVKGVASAQVLLSSSKLVVKPATDELPVGEIVKTVELLGYKVEPEKTAKSIALYIEGMDCADEVAVIEKKFKSLAGLLNLEVNLASQKVEVTYDPSRLSS